MPNSLVWTRLARADLLDIYAVIAQDHPAAAERIFDRLEALTTLLRDQPRLGPRRPDIAPGLRMLADRPYLILYRLTPDTTEGPVAAVEIIRVVDGRRDLKALF